MIRYFVFIIASFFLLSPPALTDERARNGKCYVAIGYANDRSQVSEMAKNSFINSDYFELFERKDKKVYLTLGKIDEKLFKKLQAENKTYDFGCSQGKGYEKRFGLNADFQMVAGNKKFLDTEAQFLSVVASIEIEKQRIVDAEVERQVQARVEKLEKKRKEEEAAKIAAEKEKQRLAKIEEQRKADAAAEVERQVQARVAELEKQRQADEPAETEKLRLTVIKEQRNAEAAAEIDKQIPTEASAKEQIKKDDSPSDPLTTELDTKWTKGNDLYNAKEYESALKVWKENANQGHPMSNHSVGFLYRSGYEVKKDINKAIQYYEKALSLGYANSGSALGGIYQIGEAGIKKDINKAIQYYEKALSLGSAKSGSALGNIYKIGEAGIKKDNKKMLNYYSKAAELGDAWANAEISSYYLSGKYGLEQDDSKSVSLLKRSAELGNAWAKSRLGQFYRDGINGLEMDLSKALTYFKQSAELDNQFSINQLGQIYYNGWYGVEKNHNEAEKWLLKGQELGNEESKNLLKDVRKNKNKWTKISGILLSEYQHKRDVIDVCTMNYNGIIDMRRLRGYRLKNIKALSEEDKENFKTKGKRIDSSIAFAERLSVKRVIDTLTSRYRNCNIFIDYDFEIKDMLPTLDRLGVKYSLLTPYNVVQLENDYLIDYLKYSSHEDFRKKRSAMRKKYKGKVVKTECFTNYRKEHKTIKTYNIPEMTVTSKIYSLRWQTGEGWSLESWSLNDFTIENIDELIVKEKSLKLYNNADIEITNLENAKIEYFKYGKKQEIYKACSVIN